MRKIIETYGTALSGVVLFMIFALMAPNFISPTNLMNVVKDASFLAVLALGFTLALRVGELDLSIAEIASLAAVVVGWFVHQQFHPLIGIAAAMAVAVALGAFNGFGVTRLRVPSLIVTLGVAAIAKGLSFMITQGVTFVGRWPANFTDLARGALFGLPHLLLWMVAFTASAWVLLNWTRTGAHMIATGEADEASRLAGVKTAQIKRLGLMLSSLFAGIAAILLAANLSSAAPNMAADYFLYSIASVLLGMTMFQPGHPNSLGTVYAAIVLKILGNGLVLMGAPYYLQDMMLGFIIISSVAFSASVLKKAAFKV